MPDLVLSEVHIGSESGRADITHRVLLLRVQGLVGISPVRGEKPFWANLTCIFEATIFCVIPLSVEVESCFTECLERAHVTDQIWKKSDY